MEAEQIQGVIEMVSSESQNGMIASETLNRSNFSFDSNLTSQLAAVEASTIVCDKVEKVAMETDCGLTVVQGTTEMRSSDNPVLCTVDTQAVHPRLIAHSGGLFQTSSDDFLKGCKWSPDGTTILTSSGESGMHVFDVSSDMASLHHVSTMSSKTRLSVGELVYDFAWYPGMVSGCPETCCFATTSHNQPVHLWDSTTAELRCSYRAFDHLDELIAAYSLAFSHDGGLLYCGFNKTIRVFDVSRPGRFCLTRPTFSKVVGQSGIISCLCVSTAQPGMYAAGAYSKSVALYDERQDGKMICIFHGQQSGVTHIQYSPDGTKLYSGARKDPEIICWDIRKAGNILYTLHRKVETNQRIYFDIDSSGRYVMSGNHDGLVSVWDTLGSTRPDPDSGEPILDPCLTFRAHDDTVNSVGCSPVSGVLMTGSGQRHFSDPWAGSSDSDSESDSDAYDNSVKLWRVDQLLNCAGDQV